jgi:hypothetical protein
MNTTIVLHLDPDDLRAVQEAMCRRVSPPWINPDGKPLFPDSRSNDTGLVIAEICRGWMELLEASARQPASVKEA